MKLEKVGESPKRVEKVGGSSGRASVHNIGSRRLEKAREGLRKFEKFKEFRESYNILFFCSKSTEHTVKAWCTHESR